ncbi:hypothetical protein E4U46_004777 [Claviceps purpurea]|nr:hypothetical protein E4U28_007466 [Claviceps purpurea]KAG6159584.1 hypothetical protein E4U11_004256 [Claviceps purpurea]KAG6183969.1 hypothetical protein E4U27_001107 [Claviceps purpurea]KAG6208046.1 hypothetical protein E4U50_003483 [Claviceps purpurea]KAG6295314.1 hypothetical protein E4U46_004777 [Claviceps purpurea]
MLADGALEFYLNDLSMTTMTFDEIVLAIHARFESFRNRDFHMRILNDLTLRKVMAENRGKPIHDCFELLIRQLEAIFYGYHSPSSNDTALLSQLEKAVRDIPQCEIALSINEYTYRGRIAIIRNALRLT